MEKKIVIDIEIEDGENAERTSTALFVAATDAVAHPVGFGFAKFTVKHQHLESIKDAKAKK